MVREHTCLDAPRPIPLLLGQIIASSPGSPVRNRTGKPGNEASQITHGHDIYYRIFPHALLNFQTLEVVHRLLTKGTAGTSTIISLFRTTMFKATLQNAIIDYWCPANSFIGGIVVHSGFSGILCVRCGECSVKV